MFGPFGCRRRPLFDTEDLRQQAHPFTVEYALPYQVSPYIGTLMGNDGRAFRSPAPALPPRMRSAKAVSIFLAAFSAPLPPHSVDNRGRHGLSPLFPVSDRESKCKSNFVQLRSPHQLRHYGNYASDLDKRNTSAPVKRISCRSTYQISQREQW